MGFSAIPPRNDLETALQGLDRWTSGHADAAIMHVSVPYAALLSGIAVHQEVDSNELGLAMQARYLDRQAVLLDSARSVAVFQLTFADLDLSAVSLPPGSILPLFAHLGVVDSAFGAKQALATWDSLLARHRVP